jgi:C4-dicarboxylate transporter, DctM subunit
MTFALGTLILLGLIASGTPIGFALGRAGVASLLLIVPWPMVAGLMSQVVHGTTAHYILLTIPMFVLMAEFLGAGGIAQDLMIACNRVMQRVRGGLAMAAVFTGTVMAAASGSSSASVASIVRAAYPTMRQLGYDQGFSVGTIAIAGTLAIMIPPSIAFIVYGLMTEVSVGKLFMAGLVPGLLTSAGYMATIAFMVWWRPELAPLASDALRAGEAEPQQSGKIWPILVLVVLVLGGLYSGVATPTEIGALGALGAMIIALLMGRLTRDGFVIAVGNTLRTSALIVTIVIGAKLFGYFISFTRVTDTMLAWIAETGLSPYAVLFLVIAVYIGLGMIMDQLAIIILTAPISYALLTGLGFDGVWFGVILVKTAEIGLVTPPMGLNIFIAASAARVSPRAGFVGVAPFIVAELIILGLLVAFPGLVTFLPGLI